MSKKIITSESVCKGHPDKLCDLISDSILDAYLEKDKKSRVACEVLATAGIIAVAGEITSKGNVDIKNVVKTVLFDVGYNPKDFIIKVYVHKQSSDISNGVDRALEIRNTQTKKGIELGAGDQGTVFGYATNENKEYLPTSLVKAHMICKKLDQCMKDKSIYGIGPDGKAQVSIEYENNKPVRVKSIIISVQHKKEVKIKDLMEQVCEKVILPVFKDITIDEDTHILINPSGIFINGGPFADTGLTGRKIIVDTYGGIASHGGGAFSGKDYTKVDRSAAYMARAIAKNIVASKIAERCQVSISYAIGKAEPVALDINTFSTSVLTDEIIKQIVLKVFNLKPSAIIKELKLQEVKYSKTSCYGHFCDIENNTWEHLDKTAEILKEIENYGY